MKDRTEYYAGFVQMVGEAAAEQLASMCCYIDKTGCKENADRYQMLLGELTALRKLSESAGSDAIMLAFEYGRAKGYRAAQNAAGREARA